MQALFLIQRDLLRVMHSAFVSPVIPRVSTVFQWLIKLPLTKYHQIDLNINKICRHFVAIFYLQSQSGNRVQLGGLNQVIGREMRVAHGHFNITVTEDFL
ncbi:Uncharacterised protein [Vibrio furnissii]|nr:Uncharacterised protein [Vibrio furnissii]